ncbi:hypothetical protein GMLC_35180 [Geomonas limicola]|uniref:Zinc ribbon domain-containing protein n=1 Tax=Geomonas limicola TaxID=2740186 RepID=A0A6V8NG48_9BACT|nr:hypothetical protein [Geomonas limicola]GFO69939.1 hypothetical protein GMLC_35180 [Geomonas limicola]
MQLMQQVGFYLIFFVLPGVAGARIAWTKGRNPLLWLVVNGLFPPTLLVTIFQGPARPVAGHYRQCPSCREYNKWRESVCKYCQSEFPN